MGSIFSTWTPRSVDVSKNELSLCSVSARAADGALVAGSIGAGLIEHFEPVERGVIVLRLEGQNELSLRVRLQVVEGPHDSVVHARFLVEIEAAQERRAVAEHAEDARSLAASAGISGPPILFRHVQVHRIRAAVHRDRITEVPVAFMAEHLLVVRVFYRTRVNRHAAALAVV